MLPVLPYSLSYLITKHKWHCLQNACRLPCHTFWQLMSFFILTHPYTHLILITGLLLLCLDWMIWLCHCSEDSKACEAAPKGTSRKCTLPLLAKSRLCTLWHGHPCWGSRAKSASLFGSAQHPGPSSHILTTVRPGELLLLATAGDVHSPLTCQVKHQRRGNSAKVGQNNITNLHYNWQFSAIT